MTKNSFAIYCAGKKGLKSLEAVINSSHKINLKFVAVARDKGVREDHADEIIALAKAHEIPVFERLEEPNTPIEIAIAIGWRWLIDNKPGQKIVVLHDSLLPKYRGFSPTVTALINGENSLGATAILANSEFDKGNIIGQIKIPISYPIKISQAINLLAKTYPPLVLMAIENLSEPGFTGIPQDETRATYSLWRDQRDYRIDWHFDAARIVRFIDATGFPYDGAQTYVEGNLVRILEAEQVPDVQIENRTPGKILFINNGKPTVVCGSGLLKVLDMELALTGQKFELSKYRSKFE